MIFLGEDISDAAIREVLEETGVQTRFNSLVAFRHSHGSQFGCSDIYLIVHLSPEDETQPLIKCDREIEECCWMQVNYKIHGCIFD
jgi:ADP-ribose pyrophosphatase YjhB (NUDIX family)